MVRKLVTLGAYVKSAQDRMEDRENAKIAGMTVQAFKRTPQAKTIDRAIVSLDNRLTRRK